MDLVHEDIIAPSCILGMWYMHKGYVGNGVLGIHLPGICSIAMRIDEFKVKIKRFYIEIRIHSGLLRTTVKILLFSQGQHQARLLRVVLRVNRVNFDRWSKCDNSSQLYLHFWCFSHLEGLFEGIESFFLSSKFVNLLQKSLHLRVGSSKCLWIKARLPPQKSPYLRPPSTYHGVLKHHSQDHLWHKSPLLLSCLSAK